MECQPRGLSERRRLRVTGSSRTRRHTNRVRSLDIPKGHSHIILSNKLLETRSSFSAPIFRELFKKNKAKAAALEGQGGDGEHGDEHADHQPFSAPKGVAQ